MGGPESLLRLVKAEEINYAEVRGYLEQKDTQDEEGNTSLHIACQKGSYQLAHLLLGAGADCQLRNNRGALAIDCIAGSSKLAKKLRALLNIYQRFSAKQKETGIDIFQTLYLINEALSHMKPFEKTSRGGVCLFGVTGVGKSTLTNYLRGTSYTKGEDCRLAVPGTMPEDHAIEGMTSSSETRYARIFGLRDKPYDLIDMPGLLDTHGDAYRVTAGLSMMFLTHKIPRLRALVLLCKQADFRGARIPDTLLVSLRELGRMISEDPELQQNIILAVTNPESGSSWRSVDSYMRRLEGIARDEERSTTPDLNLMTAINAFIRGEQKATIVQIDVIGGEYRDGLFDILDRMPDVEIGRFNLSNHSTYLEHFVGILESIIASRVEIVKELNQRHSEIVKLESEIARFESAEAKRERTDNLLSLLPEISDMSRLAFSSIETFERALISLRTTINDVTAADGLAGKVLSLQTIEAEHAKRLTHLAVLRENLEEKQSILDVFDEVYIGLYDVAVKCFADHLRPEILTDLVALLDQVRLSSPEAAIGAGQTSALLFHDAAVVTEEGHGVSSVQVESEKPEGIVPGHGD